jgi:hypothetical protein
MADWENSVNWGKLEEGLRKYEWIMANLKNRNVAKDKEFQKKFNDFYKVRRNNFWRNVFYTELEACKNGNPNFGNVLKYLFKNTHRMEASFSSKLCATINPELPVWDSVVLQRLKLKAPYSKDKERERKILETYEKLVNESKVILNSASGRAKLAAFKRRFPKSKISDTKRIDLILWQTRD